jgi:uncharacterized cupin superfamily protein
LSCTEGFVPSPTRRSLTSLPSYLDSLSSNTNPSNPPPPEATDVTSTLAQSFYHAPKSYFSLSNLRSKGARAADVGTPHDATRPLADIGLTSAGSWSCTAGGWPSPNPKGHTEIFYVWDGHGCLTDHDGVQHYFGPGDTVIIPKGHTGRWDVLADMHKVRYSISSQSHLSSSIQNSPLVWICSFPSDGGLFEDMVCTRARKCRRECPYSCQGDSLS